MCWRFWDDFNGDIGLKREKKVVFVIVVIFILGGVVIVGILLYYLKINDYFKKIDEMVIVFGVGFVIYFIFCLF